MPDFYSASPRPWTHDLKRPEAHHRSLKKLSKNSLIKQEMDEERNSQRWRSVDAVPPLPPPSVCLTGTGCLVLRTCRTEYLKGPSCLRACVCACDRQVQIFKCIYWNVETQPSSITPSPPNKTKRAPACRSFKVPPSLFLSSLSVCLISQPTTWQMERRRSTHSFMVSRRWISLTEIRNFNQI